MLHIGRPRVVAVVAGPRHHGETLHNEDAPVVVTVRAHEVERLIGVRQGKDPDPSQRRRPDQGR